MEFTYSLTQEQMKTGLRYYLLWRFFGLRVAYSLLAVLLGAGSCAYGIWSSHSPFFAAAGFLLLTGGAALADAFYGAGGCFPAGRGNGVVSVPRD